MSTPIVAVLPALARPLIADHLPPGIAAKWFMTAEEAIALAPSAEIGWLDMADRNATAAALAAGERLKWVSTIYAGLDAFPVDQLRRRGTLVTNGTGVNAIAVAEYAVMGMLTAAKRFPEVVRAQDRGEWLTDAPGKVELFGSRALILGYGTIGRAIGDRLKGFGVDVTGVRRTPDGEAGVIGPDAWREQLGSFDWVVLAAPATAETHLLLSAAEIAAMKPDAWLVNIARGSIVDQDALIAALAARRIGGAFLDVTEPEPLPADNPLWHLPNCIMTMHLSGRAQTRMFRVAAELFLDNLVRYLRGEPLRNQVDLARGY
ncbi:D-2-hydroxyacid dehydrogenase [Sphingomonas flavalba]|uniref:D-2-hydroxyacid dehydrogenase n=1 Tax=Sphingomonas flavalba TaxID=2559804 RepID=UPI0039E14F09